MNLFVWLSEMEYPHWIMVAGAVLLAVGFVGFVFHKNRDGAGGGPKAKGK